MRPEHTPYTHLPPKWIWALIIITEIAVIVGLYILAHSHWSFFLIGPLVVFNIFLYFLPLWLAYRQNSSQYLGKESQYAQDMLAEYFPESQNVTARMLLLTTQWDNALAFSFRRKLWICINKDFWLELSPSEQRALIQVVNELYSDQQIQAATVLISLNILLPFMRLFIKPFRELFFYHTHYSHDWQHIAYRNFYRQQNSSNVLADYWNFCLLFPALTSYRKESYLSLHTYLREKLIASFSTDKGETSNDYRQPNQN